MFRTVPLSIIRIFSLYTQQWYVLLAFWVFAIYFDGYCRAEKSLDRTGRKQARKHIRDARDFNNIETRAVIKFLFLQGNAPKEIYAILEETRVCFLPGWAKDLSAPMYMLSGDSRFSLHMLLYQIATLILNCYSLVFLYWNVYIACLALTDWRTILLCVYSAKRLMMDRGTVRTCGVLFQK